MASKKLKRICIAFDDLLSSTSYLPVKETDEKGVATGKFLIDMRPLRCKYDGNGTIELKEENPNSRGITDIFITELDSDAVIIRPDLFGIKFFKDDTYNRACDYLILTQHNSLNYAMFIDLKTDVAVEHNAQDNNVKLISKGNVEKAWQMAGGVFVLESLLALAEKIRKIPTKGGFKFVYILFFNVTQPISASTALTIPTDIPEIPPSTMVDLRNFFWFKQNNGDRVKVSDLVRYVV